MSLAVLANHMASKGRHGDDMLVHMSKDEVAALQKLAEQHGLTLTINPETGLPEAFSLKQLLGVVAPIALNLMFPGAGAAIGGALGIGEVAGGALFAGGLSALASGSLEKGLMTGLMSYGLSGLGDAARVAGERTLQPAASATDVAASGSIASPTTTAQLSQAASPITSPEAFAAPATVPSTDFMDYTPATPQAPAPTVTAASTAAPIMEPQDAFARSEITSRNAAARAYQDLSAPEKIKAAFQGDPNFLKNNWKNLAMVGLPALTMFSGQPTLKGFGDMDASKTAFPRFRFNPYTQKYEQLPGFTLADYRKGIIEGKNPLYSADGGIVALKHGGVAHFEAGGDVFTPDPDGYWDAEGNFRSTAAATVVDTPNTPSSGGTTTPTTTTSGGTTTPTTTTASYNTPRETGFVPLFGASPSSGKQATDDGPFVVGGTEPGYVAPPYDASKDPGNWYANPPAGPTFEKFKPGQETEQDYFARLRQYYESPEGQAYKAKEIADRTAAVEAIRKQYGLTGTGGGGGTATPAPGPTTGPGPTPAPAPAPGPGPFTPTVPTIPTTPGMPPLPGTPTPEEAMSGASLDSYNYLMRKGKYPTVQNVPGGIAQPYWKIAGLPEPKYEPKPLGESGGTTSPSQAANPNAPPTMYQHYDSYWAANPVGSEISWAGGKLKRLTKDSAMYTSPSGQTVYLAPNSRFDDIATASPEIAKLWKEQYGFVPGQHSSGGGGGDTGGDSGKAGGLMSLARGGMSPNVLAAAAARGGISHLGDYSDGGRLLRGPGDGVSDDIPATIANKRPARLADGEFVVPARIVSELGNGSTDAGARKLYAMMDRVQANRRKTVGKGKVAVNSRADKYLPA